MTPTVLLLQATAAAFSLLGWLILMRDGVFGLGPGITPGQGMALVTIAAVYGWWLSPIAALTGGVRGAALALVVIDVLWVFLGQGVAGYAFCAFPICPSAAPFSDVNRLGSVVFGLAAAWTAWRAYRAMPGRTLWAPSVTALALIVLAFVLQSANTTLPGS